MDQDRYRRLQEIDGFQVSPNLPVRLDKAALLFDEVTQNVILQCKLRVIGISFTELSSVTIAITGHSLNEETAEKKEYAYENVNRLGGTTFGTNTPILLSKDVRSVELTITSAKLLDGTVIEAMANFHPLEPVPFTDLPLELRTQLHRDVANYPEIKGVFLYIPQIGEGWWSCTCGHCNPLFWDECRECSRDKSDLFALFDSNTLTTNLEIYTQELEAKAAEKLRREAETKARNKWFIQRVVLPAAVAIAIVFAALSGMYVYAFARFSAGDYITAKEIFPRLLGIYDSTDLAKESSYQDGVSLLHQDQFDGAKQVFAELGDYRNSKTLYFDADYRHAEKALEEKEYTKAKALFISILSYSDAASRIYDTDLLIAEKYLSEKKPDEARKVLVELGNYKNSTELLKECDYQDAAILFAAKKYEDSQRLFKNIGIYKDAQTLEKESTYLLAKQYLAQAEPSKALDLLTKLGNYKDATEILNETRYDQVVAFLELEKYLEAALLLQKLNDYKDSETLIGEQILPHAYDLYSKMEWERALAIFNTIDTSKHPEVVDTITSTKFNLEQARKKATYDQALVLIKQAKYKDAYLLLKNLKYSNSDALASYYATLAYPWKVSGGMTKYSFSLSEHFSAEWSLTGGPPGEKINLTYVCKLPSGGKVDEVLWNVSSGDSWTYSCYYSNWIYGSTGSGWIKIKNYNTGETLATFEFWVGY